MASVELFFHERPLLEDSATLASSGVSLDTVLLAVFATWMECGAKEDAYSLDLRGRAVVSIAGIMEIPEAFEDSQSVAVAQIIIPASVTHIGTWAWNLAMNLQVRLFQSLQAL